MPDLNSPLSFGTIEKGAMRGFLAFILDLGSAKLPSPVDVLYAIDHCPYKTNHFRMVNLKKTGKYSDMVALIRALVNRNIVVSIEHPGDFYPTWMQGAQYKIAIVDEDFLGTECNEIWYVYRGGRTPDFDAGRISNQTKILLYLDSKTTVELEGWLKKSKHRWAMLNESFRRKLV